MTAVVKDDEPRSTTGTLGKAMAIVEIVAAASEPLRFTDILRASDQPRGTLHRNLSNLVDEGLLTLNRDRSYGLGVRLLQFASKSWSGNHFRAVAEPHLKHLHDLTDETVHLGVLRGVEVIYLDKVESRQAVRMYSQVGNASPAFCTGVGKAALSSMSDDDFARILPSIRFQRFTGQTLTSREMLIEEMGRIRQSGIAFDREEHEVGIRCVAAPIFSSDRSFVAGVSVTGPAYRVSIASLERWSAPVRDTARMIMEDMETKLGPRL